MDTPFEAAESPRCVLLDFEVMAKAIRSRKVNLRKFRTRVACVKNHLEESRVRVSGAFDTRAQMSMAERSAKVDVLVTETLDNLLVLQLLILDARRLCASGSYDKVLPLILELERVADDFMEVVQNALARKEKIESIHRVN